MRTRYLKLLFTLSIVVYILACENIKQNQSKQRVIDSLQNKINGIEKKSDYSTKYIFSVIYHKRGTYNYNCACFDKGVKNYIIYSQIEEHNGPITETDKYKILDNLEDQLRRKFGETVHSITKRDCMVFDNYIAASKYKQSVLNNK